MRGRKFRAGRRPDAWASVSPKGRIFASLAVLVPVALSGLALIALAPPLWWVFTTYFWIAFPALGLLARGVAELSGAAARTPTDDRREREVLEAMREHGALTPTRAAMETSLTVAEAGGVLDGLAKDGHLEVRVEGGALSYGPWEAQRRGGSRDEIRDLRGEPRVQLPERVGTATRRGQEGGER